MLVDVNVGGLYFLNYNPRLDCFWIDKTFGQNKKPKPQYICVPYLNHVYPTRHVAALYDGKPRDLFVAYDKKVLWKPNFVFDFETPGYFADLCPTTTDLEDLMTL